MLDDANVVFWVELEDKAERIAGKLFSFHRRKAANDTKGKGGYKWSVYDNTGILQYS